MEHHRLCFLKYVEMSSLSNIYTLMITLCIKYCTTADMLRNVSVFLDTESQYPLNCKISTFVL